MNGHPIDTLRLELVGIRAELRTARQDLARKKRAVARQCTLHTKTAKEREAEREMAVYEHPEVMALEDVVLKLQHQEDLAVAQLESANRGQREYEWFVRERMADAYSELAVAIPQAPAWLGQTVKTLALSPGEYGAFVGESEYMAEREIR